MSHHICSLHPIDTYGFKKLPPNARFDQRWQRKLQLLLSVNPNNIKSKEFFRCKSELRAEQRRYAGIPDKYVIHPFSIVSSVIEIYFFIVWSALMVPTAGMCDDSDISCRYTIIAIRRALLYLGAVFVILCFFMGYVDTKTNQIVLEPKQIVRRYLKTYFFFDLIALNVAGDTFKTFVSLLTLEGNAIFNIKLCLPILRIISFFVRLESYLNILSSIGQHINLPKGVEVPIIYILRTFIILHLFTFLAYIIPTKAYSMNGDEWPNGSWLVQANIQEGTYLEIYTKCMLMVVCYFFGVAHSQYSISVLNEQILLILIAMFGRLYTLFLLAHILNFFGIAGVSSSTYENHLAQLAEYITSRKLPRNLKNRLLKFYEYKFQRHYFRENDVYAVLSEHLKTELFLFAARNLIRKVTVFQALPSIATGGIIAVMQLHTFGPKDVIFEVGQSVEVIYFISSGTLAVLTHDDLELVHLEDGEFVGTTSILTGVVCHKVIALETTEMFCINRHVFMGFLQDYPAAMEIMHKSVNARLRVLEQIEANVRQGGDDLVSELKSGRLVERLHRRLVT